MTEYVLFNALRDAYFNAGLGSYRYRASFDWAQRYPSMTEALLDAERFQLSGYEAVPVEGKG